MNIIVTKRDKKTEDYDQEKIMRVVIAAGLNRLEAEKLIDYVNKWFIEKNKNIVTSLQIRDRVVIEIQKLNKAAAAKFISYEKYKDRNYKINY
ncbi:hypothetical protein A2863_01820 [Candidatus Woesebacteria bacterium RIFCSPHIGHO2_01_FULL_38_9b]|uniref:ATP-cone domain-containing protein n=1 Tax=Candidatus Woesebacteria bacterium RIFCSPHIGHO2_01_FULL_38_9b TaxID=1802493 RepID=A0A1F7XYA1_9BACT|nr:MAG: hypothetical protein A2863_01820 [Candidatus Woesebacteria bacterium RIFCSPHIGHO2_01_FULL_38_9b]